MKIEKKAGVSKNEKQPNLNFPQNLQPFYANLANFHFSLTELTINFAYKTNPQSAIVGAQIILSPQHAKIFSEVLEKLLADYEKNVGKIPSKQ